MFFIIVENLFLIHKLNYLKKVLLFCTNDNEYFEFLNQIKKEIVNTRKKVILNTNNELILMYYRIGKGLLENNKYGSNFINNLATDLKL